MKRAIALLLFFAPTVCAAANNPVLYVVIDRRKITTTVENAIANYCDKNAKQPILRGDLMPVGTCYYEIHIQTNTNAQNNALKNAVTNKYVYIIGKLWLDNPDDPRFEPVTPHPEEFWKCRDYGIERSTP